MFYKHLQMEIYLKLLRNAHILTSIKTSMKQDIIKQYEISIVYEIHIFNVLIVYETITQKTEIFPCTYLNPIFIIQFYNVYVYISKKKFLFLDRLSEYVNITRRGFSRACTLPLFFSISQLYLTWHNLVFKTPKRVITFQ